MKHELGELFRDRFSQSHHCKRQKSTRGSKHPGSLRPELQRALSAAPSVCFSTIQAPGQAQGRHWAGPTAQGTTSPSGQHLRASAPLPWCSRGAHIPAWDLLLLDQCPNAGLIPARMTPLPLHHAWTSRAASHHRCEAGQEHR